MNLTFKPIKFNNPSDLFNRPDEYTLSFPNEEPMGFLKAKNETPALLTATMPPVYLDNPLKLAID